MLRRSDNPDRHNVRAKITSTGIIVVIIVTPMQTLYERLDPAHMNHRGSIMMLPAYIHRNSSDEQHPFRSMLEDSEFELRLLRSPEMEKTT